MRAALRALEGSAYFGSDSTINAYKGVISDPILHLRALNNIEAREFTGAHKSDSGQSLFQHWRSRKDYEYYTASYSKQKSNTRSRVINV